MIIFGSRVKSALVAVLFLTCVLCKTPAAQRLVRVRTWFTLFFIPIFPFGHGRYVQECAYCGTQVSIDRDSAERFRADAEAVEDQRIARETLALRPGGCVAVDG
jgi:hypothetical protein